MHQQRPGVETKCRTLINQDLKEICKAYGQPVSGAKAVLQKRCMDILENLVQKGDSTAFDDFRFRVNNRGQGRPKYPVDSPANAYGSPSGVQNLMSRNPLSTQSRMPTSGKYFKPSPFYEIIDTVLPLQDLPDGPEMPQNRNTVKADIILSAEQCQRIGNEGLRLLLYCGLAQGMSPYHHPVDIAFPNQLEVRVNEDDLKANFKGLKNKPGSTKPADITDKLRTRPPGYNNKISLTYALTSKRYAYIVHLVRHLSAEQLTDRIKHQNVIAKQTVLNDMNKASSDPDVEATSTRMSLKDPISTVRISLPVRSTICTHNQCFDGGMFLQMMEQAPVWNCPVCNKTVSFQSLCVDKYFEDILKNTPISTEKVDVEPNGEWRIIKEEEDEQPNGASGRPRASYDDDFDDDLIEVTEPTNKSIIALKRESHPPTMLSPTAFNTPPLSSREPSVAQSMASVSRAGTKRPSGAVIDLTLSDDEEQPPRPAKRQHTSSTSHNQGNSSSTSSFHTPASLPDRNIYQASQRQADNYRPTLYSGAPGSSSHPFQRDVNGSSSDSQSPFRATSSYQPPGGPVGWPAQHSRPPSQSFNGIQSSSIRPPPSPGGFRIVPPGLGSPVRLAPMQSQAPGQSQMSAQMQLPSQSHMPAPSPQELYAYGSWRSDRGNSPSHSPD
ncbi:hypothetical protein LTR08_005990 [Meristemomyces frigidus]|nr:hypothetical protein LTR08_005990 [Meristemomyces frigidus]